MRLSGGVSTNGYTRSYVPVSSCEIRPASDRSLNVSFGDSINLDYHRRVLKLLRVLEAAPVDGVRNLHPAYASLLVVFDPVQCQHTDLEVKLREYVSRSDALELPPRRSVEIAACYGGEYGPDLADAARINGLAPDQVVALHSSAAYTVYFLGFAPGFAYLGGLPDAIATPRLDTPRRRVPAGSIGIAGAQTGVYPFATPGGWRLIGRTPQRMFDPVAGSLLRMGDEVLFRPVSREEFEALAR